MGVTIRMIFAAIIAALVFMVAFARPSSADVTINGLPAGTPTGVDTIPVWHGGTTIKATLSSVLGALGPIPASQVAPGTFGGPGPYLFPALGGALAQNVAQAEPNQGDTIIGFGDDVTYGTGSSSCISQSGASTYGAVVPAASLTGNCWLDLLGNYYQANAINVGLVGSAMQHGDGTAVAAIDRYTTDVLAHITTPATTWVYIDFGVQDALALNLSTSNYATFLADENTIIAAIVADGVPQSHVKVISTLPDLKADGTPGFSVMYDRAAAEAAYDQGVAFANLWEVFDDASVETYNSNAINPESLFIAGAIAPTVAGHALIAGALESPRGLDALLAYAQFGALDAAFNSYIIPSGANLAPAYDAAPSETCSAYGYIFAINNSPIIGCDFTNTAFLPNTSTGIFKFEPYGGGSAVATIDQSGNIVANKITSTYQVKGASFSAAGCTSAGYVIAISGHNLINCDPTNLSLQAPSSVGSVLFLNNAGTTVDSIDQSGDVAVGGHLNQTASAAFAYHAAFTNGVVTVTFTTPYASVPICTATEDGGAHAVGITRTTSNVTLTSNVTTGNTDGVELICVGNPN
jgi:hypothetical protein